MYSAAQYGLACSQNMHSLLGDVRQFSAVHVCGTCSVPGRGQLSSRRATPRRVWVSACVQRSAAHKTHIPSFFLLFLAVGTRAGEGGFTVFLITCLGGHARTSQHARVLGGFFF
eukprot:TRINITY_DN37517_c0_g1_i1.p3 TRINITY_DN37517_c0_g1~~TRINITY_DN37517_c0_g1_i1.p3  ORF type:complete len:114 (+),score=0.21 TRINITY_DN37517_c0_g1_i1:321-662(+)